ncbi:MAG: diacylglycerol kinase family protein [bacterium]
MIDRLIGHIRKQGGQYTIVTPASAVEYLDSALALCGVKKSRRLVPPDFDRRGGLTGLVACGGDGSFNLAARAALRASLPVGILPMGRDNNIAHGIYGTLSPEAIIPRLLAQTYAAIDSATVGGQVFFGSIGLGLLPRLARLLDGNKPPRFALGWSRLAAQAAAEVREHKTIVKVDAFRFEITPRLMCINLLPYSLGLRLTPASIADDQLAEVVFDVGPDSKHLPGFVVHIARGNYCYGGQVRLFRGKTITIQPSRGSTLYLDGELVDVPDNILEIEVGSEQLKVFK